MNGILSPGKEGTGNLETALVVYEPKQNEEMSLEESARRERETRLLAYWDEAPDWNLDRILSEEQLQTIDDAFANSGDEGTQVSSSPKILEKERRGRRRDADSEIDRGRRRARRAHRRQSS